MENGDYVVAIDLGTNTVATVVGTRGEGGKVRIIDCEISPVQGVVRSEIKNVELVAQSIKRTIEAIEARQQITIREAYAGISGQHIRCVKYPYYVFVGRDGEIREEDVQKLHESMGNVQAPDGETIIQIIPQNYIVDDEETMNPVGAFGNKLEAVFNFVLGDNNAVSRVKRALQKVEIRQAGLFLNAVASAEAVATEDEKEEGVAVVDIGGGTTDVTVFYKNSVRHVGIVPMGGNAINRDIRSYGILERHVESLKVRYGSAMRDQIKTEMSIKTPGLNARMPKEISLLNLAAIIEARMLDIIDFVMAEIKASGCQQKLGAGVVLTGGAAQMKDLDLLFKNYPGIDVRVATPDTVIEPGSIESASNPALATAVGLLLKGLSSGRPVRGSRPQTRPARQEAQPELVGNSYGAASTENPQRRTINTLYRERKAAADREQEFIDEETQEEPVTGKTKKGGGLFGRLKQKIDNMFDVIEDNEI
uniref:cell division protein FtsA n=1 Tax=Alistipes indistinctus TaxID=626932 RepID=UPI004027B108